MHQIELNGNAVTVTDPCYEPGTWCAKTIKNILPGKWNCRAFTKKCGTWGRRIAALTIRHEDYPKGRIGHFAGVAGVDSGQCGFFDPDYFEKNQPDDDYDNPSSWYRRVCDITSSGPEWGTIDGYGVVSSSGYGDGGYDIYTRRNRDGRVVGVMLRFI
jgi:hypothetical protein